jgi:two-component system, LytTR family, response regulator
VFKINDMEKNKLYINYLGKQYLVDVSEIYLFESVGNYVRVYFKDQSPVLWCTINKLEKILKEQCFFKVNRKCLVNNAFVKNMALRSDGGDLELMNGRVLNISRRIAVAMKSALKKQSII